MWYDLPMDVLREVRAYTPFTFRATAHEFRTNCHPGLRDVDYLRAMNVSPTLSALRHYFHPHPEHTSRLGCSVCVVVRHPVRFRCYVCYAVRRYVVASPCFAATTEGVRCRRSTVRNTSLCSVHGRRRPPPVLAAARWVHVVPTVRVPVPGAA